MKMAAAQSVCSKSVCSTFKEVVYADEINFALSIEAYDYLEHVSTEVVYFCHAVSSKMCTL